MFRQSVSHNNDLLSHNDDLLSHNNDLLSHSDEFPVTYASAVERGGTFFGRDFTALIDAAAHREVAGSLCIS